MAGIFRKRPKHERAGYALYGAAVTAAAFRGLRDRICTRRSRSANEKGGVVRRPFSKLQAWLIAVSPQPGVETAIGKRPDGLEWRR